MHNMPSLSRKFDALNENARQLLQISEKRYRRLFETAQDGILLLNADTAQIEDVNPFLIKMLGYSHAEFLGKKLWEVGLFSDIQQCKDMFLVLQKEGYIRYENLPLRTRTAQSINVEFVSNSYDCDGIKVIQCNIRDISERIALNLIIQRHTQLYSALSQCNQAIVHCSCKEELFLKICRIAVEPGGMKMAFICLIDPETPMLRTVAGFGNASTELEHIDISLSIDSPNGHGPVSIAIRESRPYWCQDFMHDPLTIPWQKFAIQQGWAAAASLPLYQDDTVIGAFVLYSGEINAFDDATCALLVEMAADVSFALDNLASESMRKQAMDEVEHLAFYDPLTSLPNRRLLHQRLQSFVASEHHTHNGAIMMLDLDNFKSLNDTLGHNIGDLLLIEVALRLQACLGKLDTVVRLGGDEFIVLLVELAEDSATAIKQAEITADKILASISQPYCLKGYEYHGSTSIGISLFNDGEVTEADLLKRTDTAMYQAKSAGGNTKRFYNPAMQAALEYRTALARDLHGALAEKQLSLYFQVQVENTKHILGAEVLLRWHHPEHGMVSPLVFIPLAEEKGLIVNIGHWVLETACEQLKVWETDPRLCQLQLAVNVSARQFYQPDFVEQVVAMLKKTGINPNRLKLELTESLVMDDIDDTIIKMHGLRHAGVSFSLDDFGTGYSSLAYLTLLPVDQLKIDQSFVRNIGLKHTDAVIVQTIIGMAHNLGMQVIAEGVETEAQRQFLERHGCSRYQGYLFNKPVPAHEFQTYLQSFQTTPVG